MINKKKDGREKRRRGEKGGTKEYRVASLSRVETPFGFLLTVLPIDRRMQLAPLLRSVGSLSTNKNEKAMKLAITASDTDPRSAYFLSHVTVERRPVVGREFAECISRP